MKRTGPTNYLIIRLARELRKAGNENNAKVWHRVAELILRPTRKRVEVNLSKINRYAKENEIVVVPGKVLGSGTLDKPVTVAALSFSKGAILKIKSAGGKAITISELLKENPKGSRVRIMI